jgi:hypothetical protein
MQTTSNNSGASSRSSLIARITAAAITAAAITALLSGCGDVKVTSLPDSATAGSLGSTTSSGSATSSGAATSSGSAGVSSSPTGGTALTAADFSLTAPHGFGDYNNSWAQAMIWWKGHLYVGTSRDAYCESEFAVQEWAESFWGPTLGKEGVPYPLPAAPDGQPFMRCTPNPADLPLAAQIWRWSPNTDPWPANWQQVYESPDTLPNPGPGPGPPPAAFAGKLLPYESGFRGFAAYTEADGTEALYAFSVNAGATWNQSVLPPPRILRTTDGEHWTPLPQDPGTFLADLPFETKLGHNTYRSPVVYNGMLFTLCGQPDGEGSLIASADPSQGDDAWFLAEPGNMEFYELAVFNGWLYIGGFALISGDNSVGLAYTIYKTKAEGSPPYQLTQVVPPGAGLTSMPSDSVVSMSVHNGRLYVGTDNFPELIRINADDTWDLVMGTPRVDPVTQQWKYPTSNLGPGFGLTMNIHVWYQAEYQNRLYAGTANGSTWSQNSSLEPDMGGQLYSTPDDWYWTAVTTNAFTSPSNPEGGKWDMGIRTLKATPYGLFVGTANDYFGAGIYLGTPGASPAVAPPARLDIEASQSGGALLSWLPDTHATSYQIWRAQLLPIQVRPQYDYDLYWQNLLFLSGTVFGEKITDTYPTVYEMIGVTREPEFLDSTVAADGNYMYYVVGVNSKGVASSPSNLQTFPTLLPPATFAGLSSEVTTLAARGRFTAADPKGIRTERAIQIAEAAAATCRIPDAIDILTRQMRSRAILSPDSGDHEVLVSRLIRRLELYKGLRPYSEFPKQVISTEFCDSRHRFER